MKQQQAATTAAVMKRAIGSEFTVRVGDALTYFIQ